MRRTSTATGTAGERPSPRPLPFDAQRLDELLADANVDVVLATSGHAVRHLLGGYRFFLYETLDGIGRERYLPVVGWVRGQPELGFYLGAGNEQWGTDVASLWPDYVEHGSWSARQAAERAVARLRKLDLSHATIAVEPPYVPGDAWSCWSAELGTLRDAGPVLDELRAVKTDAEQDLIRRGADAVVDAMLAVFGDLRGNETTAEIAERLRVAETERGLTFGYCLVAAGRSTNRAPSDVRLTPGAVLSLDSGAHLRGYVADLARMAVVGEPSARQQTLLDQVDEVQRAARATIAPGRRGGDLFDVAHATIARLPDGARMSFLAHGTGLLSHEAPRLTDTGSPPYPATHRELPLQAGMALSVETHVIDDDVGFVKLEDTMLVTADGHTACGDSGRGFSRIGT